MKRSCLWMLLAAGCGRAPDPVTEARFLAFNAGTTWTYDAEFAGAKRKAVLTVSARETGRLALDYDLFNPPDPGATASMEEAWFLEAGYVVWGEIADGRPKAWWRTFKLGARPGDTWTGPHGKGSGLFVGLEEVVVPAGRFTDVLHTRVVDDDAKTHDFYFAPKDGLVKWETAGPRGASLLQLREFKAAP